MSGRPTPLPSVAKHDPKRGWVDGAGNLISGPYPLAQLGVGGQYEHPSTGRVMTIRAIETDAQGYVTVTATG